MPLDTKENRELLILGFPKLIHDPQFKITSPCTEDYNCIAWAIGKDNAWCAPPRNKFDGSYWPIEDKSMDPQALIKLFESRGFKLCEDSSFEKPFVKVALYVSADGTWTHAARQDRNGNWKSKLGSAFDIIHGTPFTIENDVYGEAKYFMASKF